MKTEICRECEYHRRYYTNSELRIVGCIHPPYRGKWVEEIECPKDTTSINKIVKMESENENERV